MADEEERYITLDIPGTDMCAQAKLDDEGMVLDLFKRKGDSIEVVKSAYLMYSEINADLIFLEEE